MRVGSNPLRGKTAAELADVVLCVVTHLPEQAGYHAERLEVVQTCLRSMTQNAGMEYSLCVWDNGSCDELREWIFYEVKPDVFVQSINLGKTTGRTGLTRMIPPGKVVCYSDDDILFYPNWLRPQIELLRHFPGVACVSGYPVRTAFRWGNANTKAWARKHAALEIGRYLPREWEDDFAVSIGRDPKWHAEEWSQNDNDARITYKGKQAYATAHHCQFIGKSDVLSRAMRFDKDAMGDERALDERLDSIGLRLATIQRYTRHIGNVLHDELRKELETMQLEIA